jgi:membrane protein DedA with SNARE-associated domain
VGTASLFSGGTIDAWLASYGYVVVFVFVMIESLGVPFPGETALIAAAIYAGATGNLAIWWVIAVAAGAAIVGDNIGFSIGRYGGARLLLRYGDKVRLDRARLKVGVWVFRRHGGAIVFFGRFVSVLRTYAAFLAGTNRMRWPRFLVFNAAGGIIWATIYGVAYYVLGNSLKRLNTPIDIAIATVAAAVLIGAAIWIHRKEGELKERADRELPGSIDEELGLSDDGAEAGVAASGGGLSDRSGRSGGDA